MGKNKLAKFKELETFPNVFQVSAATLMQEEGFPLKGNWHKIFFKNDNPIILELGCGKGEYTVKLAELNPHINYIGVDIKGARIWTGAKYAHINKMPNVAFIRTNIEMMPHFFDKDEVAEIWLTFPDPQMKKRTKRLTATNFIKNYNSFLKENGKIHLKTDSNFMFQYTLAMVAENRFEIVEKYNNLYQEVPDNALLTIKTYYEKQWIERGLEIKYLCFISHQIDTLVEPEIDIQQDEYRSFKRYKRQL